MKLAKIDWRKYRNADHVHHYSHHHCTHCGKSQNTTNLSLKKQEYGYYNNVNTYADRLAENLEKSEELINERKEWED